MREDFSYLRLLEMAKFKGLDEIVSPCCNFSLASGTSCAIRITELLTKGGGDSRRREHGKRKSTGKEIH